MRAPPGRTQDRCDWPLSHLCWRQDLINAGLILDFLPIAHLIIDQPLRITLAKGLFLFDSTRKKKEDHKGDEVMGRMLPATPTFCCFGGFQEAPARDRAKNQHSFSSSSARVSLPRRLSLASCLKKNRASPPWAL